MGKIQALPKWSVIKERCTEMEKVLKMGIVLVTLWIILSYADVLAHNAPAYGDEQYSKANVFILAEKAYNHVR
jgi:hypothetical protein